MMQSGYNITDLVQEAQIRWLKPAEVLFILQNHEDDQITHEPPQKPSSGSLFLFNKRVLRFFRKDGHSWRRKKDGRTVGEGHERLKVGNVEALNCYYAHGEQNPNFQRRSYWMLDPGHDHIVLVHYRDISISPSSTTTQPPASTAVVSELVESYESTSSPYSGEVSSDVVIKGNGTNNHVEAGGSPEIEINQALRKLEEQLSLNDENLNDIGTFYSENENSFGFDYALPEPSYRASEMLDGSNNRVSQQYSGDNREMHQYNHQLDNEFTTARNGSLNWNDILNYDGTSQSVAAQEKFSYISDGNGAVLPPSRSQPVEEQVKYHSVNISPNNVASTQLPQELEEFKFPAYSSTINTYGLNPDYYPTLYDRGQTEIPLGADSCLTIAQEQKYTIREISPEWGYASEGTKVIVIGSFNCDPSSSSTWTCMFGDIEVPVEIIQEGVLCCQAPPRLPGKVNLCITSGNRESCSEVKEFEYRVQPNGLSHNPEKESSSSTDELLLLVRFVQMLLAGPSPHTGESTESRIDFSRNLKGGEDSWNQVIEGLLFGSLTSANTTDWLLEELLKDKLQQWLSSRSRDEKDPSRSFLLKRDQGLIHMVSGLGFGWALTPILNSGVGVNFRDINGWTALHWAARFGREKMVAELLAAGASAGAVTDPTTQDPTGKTPASIAATFGHNGLAGYLSEVALTSHLSSLTLEQTQLSKSSVHIEPEKTVNTISETSFVTNEDQLSLKDTLAAVRNATQAAARIQSAFRAHSFRMRQQKDVIAYASGDEFDILGGHVQGLSAGSKFGFRGSHDHNAALSIQKKYRGWKGRKDFLDFRQKVVKIQAHVRGHQGRKNYKVICWATGVLEKVVLRWRRKRVGLRGFKNGSETIEDSEEEDIVKVFRKQKVDAAVDEAVSSVLSMVESPDARQQYRRMLEKYRQAKAERASLESEAASTSQIQTTNMENDHFYQFTQ